MYKVGDLVECLSRAGNPNLVVGRSYYVVMEAPAYSNENLVYVSEEPNGRSRFSSFESRFKLLRKGSGEVQRTSPIRLTRALPRRLLLLTGQKGIT